MGRSGQSLHCRLFYLNLTFIGQFGFDGPVSRKNYTIHSNKDEIVGDNVRGI